MSKYSNLESLNFLVSKVLTALKYQF